MSGPDLFAGDPRTLVAPSSVVVSPQQCPTPTYGVHSTAPGSGKTVALTFDDGPGNTTNAVLSVLQRYGVTATFFNIGANDAARPTGPRAEATMGMLQGNHTWDHPDMATLSAALQNQEMAQASSEQALLVNQPACVFRPPGGSYNTDTLNAAQARGMSVWLWSVDTEDWKANGSSDPFWINRIITLAEAGSSQTHPVILMHNQGAGNPATVAALPTIIEYYRGLGYTFVDLLGGTGTGTPSPAASATNGGVHVFAWADEGSVSQRTRSGGTWSATTSLGGLTFGGPAAVADGPNATTAFAQGLDNHVWTRQVTDNGTLSAWTDLGGLATSRPAAAIDPAGTITIVVRGTDASAWMRQRVNGQWGAWTGLGGYLISAPTVAAPGANRPVVAGVGADTALWVKHFSGTWSAWTSAGGVVSADPALTTRVGGTGLLAATRGVDDRIWVNLADPAGTTWSGFATLGGAPFISGAAATLDGTALDVFARATDGRVNQNLATDGTGATGWSGWQPLP